MAVVGIPLGEERVVGHLIVLALPGGVVHRLGLGGSNKGRGIGEAGVVSWVVVVWLVRIGFQLGLRARLEGAAGGRLVILGGELELGLLSHCVYLLPRKGSVVIRVHTVSNLARIFTK